MDKVLIGYFMWEVFVFIVNFEIYSQEFLKFSFYFFSIFESEVIEDQIEVGFEVGSFLYDVFKGRDGIIVLFYFYKYNVNVLYDFRFE